MTKRDFKLYVVRVVDTVCPAAVSVSADKNADCGG